MENKNKQLVFCIYYSYPSCKLTLQEHWSSAAAIFLIIGFDLKQKGSQRKPYYDVFPLASLIELKNVVLLLHACQTIVFYHVDIEIFL